MMRWLVLFVLIAGIAGCNSTRSPTQTASAPSEPFFTQAVPTAPRTVSARAYAAIVVDARNGKVLHEDQAESLRYPASLTKMMTLYLLFEELEAGRLSRSSPLQVSAEAASRPPAKIGVKAGTPISVDTAIRALAVRSANDVAAVIAENIAGSEEAFARRMTQKARALGMRNTVFKNASGLPDTEQYTTARDIAILGASLNQRFPSYFRYFSTRSFTYNGRTWKNTNKLLTKVRGMNGIKTGYIRLSGFNLCASVNRDGRHVIAVVFGGRSGSARNAQMEALINEYMPKASRAGLFNF